MNKNVKIVNLFRSILNLSKFEMIKLKDGSEIKVDAIEVGKPVVDVNDNPVADGDYELEDGRIIVVKGGVIESIKEVETEMVEETPATETPAETPANGNVDVVELDKRVAHIEAILSAIFGEDIKNITPDMFGKVDTKEADDFSKLKEEIKVLNDKFETIANQTVENKTEKKINKNESANRFDKYFKK